MTQNYKTSEVTTFYWIPYAFQIKDEITHDMLKRLHFNFKF